MSTAAPAPEAPGPASQTAGHKPATLMRGRLQTYATASSALADHRRDHRHRDLLPGPQLAVPHRGQLRQPDRPDVGDHVIGMGIVFVLLLGEIDLSIGYVSGMGGVVAAVLLEPGKNMADLAWPSSPALGDRGGDRPVPGLLRREDRRAVVRGHAGRTAWAGTASCCRSSAARARSSIQDNFVNGLANNYIGHTLAWVVAIACVAAYVGQQLDDHSRRAGRRACPTSRGCS